MRRTKRAAVAAVLLVACLVLVGCATGGVRLDQRRLDVLADLVEAEIEAAEPFVKPELHAYLTAGREVAEQIREGLAEEGFNWPVAFETLRALGPVYRQHLASRGLDPGAIEERVRPLRIALAVAEIAVGG